MKEGKSSSFPVVWLFAQRSPSDCPESCSDPLNVFTAIHLHPSICDTLICHCFTATRLVCIQSHKTCGGLVTRPSAKLLNGVALPGCLAEPVHRVRWVCRVVSDLLENKTTAISVVMQMCDARRTGQHVACDQWIISYWLGCSTRGSCAAEGSSVSSQPWPLTQFYAETRDRLSRWIVDVAQLFFMCLCYFLFFFSLRFMF